MIGFRSFTRKFGCIIYATHSPGFNGDVEWRLVSAELSLVFTFYCMMIRWCGMTVGESWIQLCFHPFIKKKKKKRKKKSVALTFCCTSCRKPALKLIDAAKWAGWAGLIGLRVDRVTSRVELTRIFQISFFFFFFEIDVICQLFLISLTVIRFSLVILLPLTNYH